MNKIRAVNPRRLIFFAVLLLLVSVGVLLWMREVIREIFVLPLSYLFFIIGIFVRSTPEIYFWIVVLIFSSLIAYRSLDRKAMKQEQLAPYEMAELAADPARRGRVYSWLIKYQSMRNNGSEYYSSNFHQSLGRLLLDLLSHRYHLPPLQVEQRLRSDTLAVPPDVREYLLNSLRPREPVRPGLMAAIREWFTRAFQNLLEGRFPQEKYASLNRPENRVDAQVARIIKYMEEDLEVPHDDSGR
jgi:hypothetical protein